MPFDEIDFFRLIETLHRHQVDYILVGGLCAVIHGAPVSTFDMDIVHARTKANIARLLKALEELEAYYRYHGNRRIAPIPSHLASPGHQLLTTKAGPLDVLGTVASGLGYEQLIEKTCQVDIEGMSVRLLELEELIRVKEATGRDKDLMVLPVLRQTLALRSKAG